MTMVLAQRPEVETLLPLSRHESNRLKACEEVIERGLNTFYEVGAALAEVRDSRLYRIRYATFEDYCLERWGMTRQRIYQLIAAAAVVENVNNCLHLPDNEAQTRELAKLDEMAQQAVWQIAVNTAPKNGDDKPLVTAAHVKSVVSVLSEVVKAGGLDDGSGEVKPLGKLIDAAVTEETYERMMRQKEYIRDRVQMDDDEDDALGSKPRQKSDRGEVEALYTPEIQARLARYIEVITEFENMEWPPELAYLLRMFQMHKSHANFQKSRNLDDDCSAALGLLKRLSPDPKLGFEIAAQEHYDWLFDLGYCMSKKQYTERMKFMSQEDQRMALWTDAGGEARQEGRRGALPGIVVLPWKKIWKVSGKCKRCKRAVAANKTYCDECSGEEEHY